MKQYMNEQELEFKNATEVLRREKLSETEKRSMLAHIYQNGGATSGTVRSPFAFSMFFNRQQYLAAAAIVLLLTGGTAYASAGSLPGDPLYALKVEIVEPLALALHFDEKSKNEYRIAILQERVLEIQTLKEEGRLDYNLEEISAAIAQENVTEIEASAVFDAAGENIQVSGHIDAYNSLVEEPHHLETIIRSTLTPDRDKEPEQSEDENDERDSTVKEPLEELVDTAEEATREVGDVLEETGQTVEATVEEVTHEVEDIVKPLQTPIKNIGL
jgi:hypothetical protein